MTQMTQAPVVIAGAGIGGLTLALGLTHYGIPCRVLERRPSLAETGAGIMLWNNALRVLDHLGAGDAVRRRGRPAGVGLIGLSDGTVLARTEPEELGLSGVSMMAFHRRELQRALFDALPEGIVTFGVGVESYEDHADTVTVRLSNGEAVRSRLLVGADGLRSRIRGRLLGDTPLRYAGYAFYGAVCPIPDDWGGACGEFMGNGERFGVVEIPGQRLYWYAVLSQAEGTPRLDEPKAALRERFGRWAFDAPTIIEHTDPECLTYHELFDRVPVACWSKGHVTLLGDAAHPTTPNLGQGAAMAMESALVLARLLAGDPVNMGQVLRRYEQTRYLRTRTITEASRRIGRLFHVRNPVLRTLRNWIVAYAPKSVRIRPIRSVVNYDASVCALAG